MDTKTVEKSEKSSENKQIQQRHFSPASLLTPFEEMERWAEELMPSHWFRSHRRNWPSMNMPRMPFEGRIPKVDVINRDDEVLIKAELPGVKKDDIEVSMTDNMITIKGSTRKEQEEEKGDYFFSEISEGSFSRSIALPAEVNIDKSEAKFKNGMLELKLPKMESAKRRTLKVD